jgi:phosphatidate cytidylyltransferase
MTTNKSSRVLVNLLGIPSLLAIIIAGDTFNNLPIFSVFIAVVLFLGAREITTLSIGKNGQPVIPLLLIFLAILQIDRHPAVSLDIPIYLLILGITLTAMIIEIFRRQEKPLLNISILVFAFVWLGIMLGSLSNLRNLPDIGFRVTFALFLSVWICDTSAFFFGKKFGERKILPDVSPNKTWMGTIAGFMSSIIVMFILYQYDFFSGMVSTTDVLIIGIITGCFGQLGDWTESLLKREAGLKDTSNFLRGHGGILDRFDSLTFAAPLTFIYCNYFIKIGQ